MVLGTANFNWNYNNSKIEKDDCFKMLEYFEKNGGEIIDTAANYHGNDIIREYGWKKKIITKVWNKDDYFNQFNELGVKKFHCVMVRDTTNKELVHFLLNEKKQGLIDEVGASIYFPHEITQNVNAFHIPNSPIFDTYLSIMLLYSNVYIRSNYNLYKKSIMYKECRINGLKSESRPDLNHKIEFVVGCRNIEQLKEDMEIFK